MNGKFLSEKRIEVGLSQSQIAEELGYSTQMISLWENDKSFPNLYSWSKYASLLGIDLEGFLLGIDKKDNNFCEDIIFNEKVFSNNLRSLRKKAALTQAAFAKIINVNVSSVIRFEKGESFPNLNQFIAICNYYHLKFDNLYFSIDTVLPTTLVTKNKKRRLFLIFIPIIITLSTTGVGVGTVTAIQTKANKSSRSNNQEVVDVVDNGGEQNQTDNSSNDNGDESIVPPGDNNPNDNNGEAVTPPEDNNPNDNSGNEQNNDIEQKYIVDEDIITFGMYPKTHVSDVDLLNSLNALTTQNELGYYSLNNNLYEKCTSLLLPGAPDGGYYFDNDDKIINNQDYWFKVEPLKWKILEETEDYYFVATADSIDACKYSLNLDNNYIESYLREFLNNDLYNKAFDGIKDNILLTEVDNSKESTNQDINHFTCENTNDYVFALSCKELNTNDKWDSTNNARKCYLSEYARIKGVYSGSETGIFYSSYYWLRSPSASSSEKAYFINHYGGADHRSVNENGVAVRPALRLKKINN